ncbi:hypothetical protein E4U35_002723 [Claviceps purpurea]|nr:hypothetical protein E4U36_003040 [Claviceps purpurea]KAG6205282.1 hypothetical protein E4U35_002723 [Claviceps purpurea]KAG6272559.1 hypothetical protein E4U47_002481 [Claviceps purpurea]KAG6311085.1 hypothetical protein E4U44_004706 [Claviceps purpurea]
MAEDLHHGFMIRDLRIPGKKRAGLEPDPGKSSTTVFCPSTTSGITAASSGSLEP